MIDLETGIIISSCVVVTYVIIKIINRLFDSTIKKNKNSLF
jgi:hypothetical protein